MLPEFANEAFTDFSVEANRRAMMRALEGVASEAGREYPLVIGGEELRPGPTIRSLNPSDPEEVVGVVARADQALAGRALEAAWVAFDGWRDVSPEARARYGFKAAALLRRRRMELAAVLVLEVGKSWPEADADVAEAIDFLEFYAREAIRLGMEQPLTRVPTEDNELRYLPLGAGVVIPPWNFPLAILAGMTSAAFLAGNTVVLKPASAAPVIACKFLEVLRDAGLPAGVVNLCPGPGEAVGDYLVQHPRTRFVSFTGSRDVGLGIHELAARHAPGQVWLKRVVAEMGGKDAIVVDQGADLDAAVDGIVASAFGYQGQKCSACSRAIVHQAVHDRVVEAVADRARRIPVGDVRDPRSAMGPLIDEAALEKVLSYIEVGRREGRLVAGGGRIPGKGWFVQPTVFADVAPRARLAQEEVFGPVLAMVRASDFEEALAMANDSDYGLTGSVYSSDRAHLELARRRFHVGNLYLNRKCTGALVGVHPFGGFQMSGTDSKAGGRDYLLLYSQAKVTSERL
ncbi:MAG: L-glutamate gamma-semialdehyde dehydrogenase [Planctomycetes bacterium]|nr:L-glutamate gamma-semialdehyde dehydrogenase [Planctomycetota bacterium]